MFYSDTKLIHLVTKLKAIPPGPPLEIQNNCFLPQQTFFGKLLEAIFNTQKIMTRLLSLSSFPDLLQCNSYLRCYFMYARGMPSHMTCPCHYRPSLSACKACALRTCHGLSPHEKMFLTEHSRHRRSSFLCHASFLGLFRKLYEAFVYSCEPNHVIGLKDTLRKLSAVLVFLGQRYTF